MKIEWLPFGIGRRIRDRRLAREWQAAVDREDVVDNIGEAKWVVIQGIPVGGKEIRYVRSNLFARHGDIAIRKEEFLASQQWGKKEHKRARKPRGIDV